MSDDRIREGLDAYAEHLQRTTGPAPAAEIRRRGDRRRRNRAVGAAFAAVLIAAAGLGTVLNRGGGDPDRTPQPAAPSVTPSFSWPPPLPSRPSSDVTSTITVRGVDLNARVVIDVPDDGLDRWMQVGVGGVVDFSGSAKDETTSMIIFPAPVDTPNRVVVTPAARPGYCVAATSGVRLTLQPCENAAPAQTWTIAPEGDSGAFSLTGPNGGLKVGDGGLATDGRGVLQTIRF
ncbi:hypothetical protein [Paractinoplanes lichenicola]|uniref:Ricin B lectin domain-containing protein n=1 Tax=Paractinoplanes lichenicola TaxID=2802976 RepID=A0ABS1VHK6_9ACTN|nr:hypothetical protein [Actinoplanes lichenicola]MBL7254198.1 hypothetical protein [Actinoplanes lichenicola]